MEEEVLEAQVVKELDYYQGLAVVAVVGSGFVVAAANASSKCLVRNRILVFE